MATIVVLDDDLAVLDLLQTVLTEAGHEPIVADHLDRVPPDQKADLVIVDLVPVKAYSGERARAWIAALRGRFGRAPLMVVTAHADAVTERDRLGADAVLSKPFDIEELRARIDELLG